VSVVVLDSDVVSTILRRRTPVNDSWIAACCLVRELPLATFNTKDYVDFVEHEGLVLLP
jgi:predicted nucleic acid-binding protein